MPAKTPPKGKKAAAPKAPKKTAAKAKKPPVDEDDEAAEAAEDLAADDAEGDDEDFDLGAAPEGEGDDEDEDDDDEDGDDEDDDDEDDGKAKKAAKSAAPAKPAAKKPAAPAPAAKAKSLTNDDAPAVVPARRLTPEAKARVNEMVKKGMSLSDALKQAASWETFVAPVKDEPAKLVQGRMGQNDRGGGGEPRHSNFAGETEPEDVPEAGDDDEPASADED
ncbi:MAG TPA: hypothetical protein VIA18_04140 [Polyangia bacterium]|nr:hypothetical protein [Polyangia bacterium]